MYQLLKVAQREHKKNVKPSSLRKNGFIPGVIFAKGLDSISVKVAEVDLFKFLRSGENVFEVDCDGTKHLASFSHVQREPASNKVVHVSFHKLERNQKTTIQVPIHIVGEAKGAKEGGFLAFQTHDVEVFGLPKDIPEFIEVNVEGLEIGHSLTLEDLELPHGLEIKCETSKVVASCTPPKAEVEETPDTEETTPEEASAAATAEETPEVSEDKEAA